MRRDRRADIGIGTMIVFIAMVLVAAVAAAVLISTANSVREQATSTGDQTINNVASGFIKEGIVGYIDSTNNLASVNITLRLAAGSPNVYMKNVVVKVLYAANDVTLTWSAGGPTANYVTTYNASLKYEVNTVTGLYSADTTVKQGDLLNIQIGGLDGATAWDLNIGNLKNLQIQVMPGFGQPTLIDVTTPEVYLGTYSVLH